MELKKFLTKLFDFGLKKEYFIVNKIGKLDKTCCNESEIEAIDFDCTKEILCKQLNLSHYKSCDALILLIENERIDFIEMKGLKEYLNPKHKNSLKIDNDISEQIKGKVVDFNIVQKIQDSLDILKLIIQDKDFQQTKSDKEIFKAVEKNFILLTDIDSSKNGLEFILASLEVLSQNSTSIENICMEIFSEEIENIHFPNIYNIQKPISLNCEGLIRFYT